MTLSPNQLRAARAHLNIEQGDIHSETGIAQSQISAFENEKAGLSQKNLNKLIQFFESRDIEFIENDGIRLKPQKAIRNLEGTDGFVDFLHDVFLVVKSGEKNVVVNNVDEKLFLKWEGSYAKTHQSRMQEYQASYKIIVEEGDDNFTASTYAQYRWAAKERIGEISYYIYGDRTALIDFQDNNVFVYIIRNIAVADFFREEFNKVWGLSRPPS